MGVDAACCPQVRTRFFSRQEGRPLRKAHHPFHGTRRYNAHAEVWLDSNLFVTLPVPSGNRSDNRPGQEPSRHERTHERFSVCRACFDEFL